MKATTLLALLVLSFLLVPLAAEAQQPTKVSRVGRLIAAFAPAQPSPILKPSSRRCAISGTSRGGTSSWSTAMRRGAKRVSATRQRSWSSSRWT